MVPVAEQLHYKVDTSQRGFVRHRRLEANVISADSTSRMYAMEDGSSAPAMLALDYGSAFSSMAHPFIYKVLSSAGLPIGFQTAMLTMLQFIGAHHTSSEAALHEDPNGQGFTSPAFWHSSGIRQGCPSSGWVWAVASHVLLKMLRSVLDQVNHGEVCACADDLLITVRALKHLAAVSHVLETFRQGSEFSLQLATCCLVPLWDYVHDARLRENWIRKALRKWTVQLGEIPIASCTPYLGTMVGPGATLDDIWQGVVRKWHTRLQAIAGEGGSSLIRMQAYSSRVQSLLPYLCQLYSLPMHMRKEEMRALAVILKWPHGTLARQNAHHLDKWGGRNLRTLGQINAISLMRASGAFDWAPELSKLRSLAVDRLLMVDWNQGLLSPRWWQMGPIVERLMHASQGFASLPSRDPASADLRRWGKAVFDTSALPATVSEKDALAYRMDRQVPPDDLALRFVEGWKKDPDPALHSALGAVDWGRVQGDLAKSPPLGALQPAGYGHRLS